MSKEKYCELIDQLCESLGLDSSNPPYDPCGVQINGIVFSLAPGGPGDEDSLYIYCDFGEPPEKVKAQVLQRLMETNLWLYGNNTPMYGFNAETGHILMMHRMSISQLAFGSLAHILGNFVEHINKWRQVLFTGGGGVDMGQVPLYQPTSQLLH